MTEKTIRFHTEIVNGICPTCSEYTMLVGLTRQYYRCITCGADLEQPLAIARDIKKLYQKLLVSKNNLTVDQFLIENSDLRHVVRRAFIIEKFPYSEIQDNTISENIVPIDMLRLKLSFFGALKFDPRSDKWLRICMFQGAPLPNELKNFDEQWVYKSHS